VVLPLGTLWPEVRDDLPGALLPPRAADGARAEITPDLARVVNGRLTAEIDSRGRVRFTRTIHRPAWRVMIAGLGKAQDPGRDSLVDHQQDVEVTGALPRSMTTFVGLEVRQLTPERESPEPGDTRSP
jgi:hypothetical protein